MPSNFPATDDVFNVPSDPVNTPLGTTGDGSRKHSEHHRDLGDAVEAMQAQQTLLAHSHDGATFRHGNKLAQANTHQSPDTDSATSALHHTIGSGANQGAAGTHTHDIVAAYPVGAFFFSVTSTNPSSLGFPGTWVDVGQRFLVAQDGGTFVAGATSGTNTHTHTNSSVSTTSDHSHTFSDTDNQGSHTHTQSSVNSAGASHYHDLNSAGLSTGVISGTGGNSHSTSSHTHRSASSSPSHSHSLSTLDANGGHVHTVSASGSTGGHTHTVSSTGSTSNLPPYLVVYMFKRTV